MRTLITRLAPLPAVLALLAALASPPARAETSAAPRAPAPAAAQQPAAPALTPAQAQQALEVLNDPAKRAAVISTLEAIAKAAPPASAAPAAPAATPAPAGPAAKTAPAAPAAPAPPAAEAKKPALAPNSVGAQFVLDVSQTLRSTFSQAGSEAENLTRLPLLWRWLQDTVSDPVARQRAEATGWKLAVVLAAALLAEQLLLFPVRRIRARLARYAPNGNGPDDPAARRAPISPPPRETEGIEAAEHGAVEPPQLPELHRRRLRSAWAALRRLPFALIRLVLDLLPVGLFTIVGLALLGTELGRPDTTRLVIIAVVQAYAITRAVISVGRTVLEPEFPRLRLVTLSTANAVYLVRWLRWIVAIAMFGYALAAIGTLLDLYTVAGEALLKLVALVVHLLLVVIVLQKRGEVAEWIRPPALATGVFARLRRVAARYWHWFAIAFLIGQWVVYAVEVPHGFARLARFLLVTIGVLIVARIVWLVALGAVDRSFRVSPELAHRYPGLEARASRYYPAMRALVGALVAILTGLALLIAWGVDVPRWFHAGRFGNRLVSALLTIVVTLAFALAVWEIATGAIERYIARLARGGQAARAARVRTLVPMLRTAMLITILVVVGLTALSQVGVDIAPLLAGAGIVGVAVGFGSQTLVKDLITGLFLLLENAMQVGDWVTAGGLSGTVEHLSLRTIRLRGNDGSVHIVPFSSVTTVSNFSRDYARADITVNVSYKADIDQVFQVLRDVATEMRRDPDYADKITGDLQLLGVDKLGDTSVTILGRMDCTLSGRWPVQREMNRRINKRFQELGIEIA